MAEKLKEMDWRILISRIAEGNCTPFIGAGACYGHLPLGEDIAKKLAEEYKYPLQDSDNLSRVAQFVTVECEDAVFVKEEIVRRWFKDRTPPDFEKPTEPLSVLADLPLKIYMTTNYDDFIFKALENRKKKPIPVLCRWNSLVKDNAPKAKVANPDPSNPLIFHFHGSTESPISMVVTEDDYLDFMVNLSRNDQLLPHRIRRALTGTSLLFIGYSITDLNFRVLFRSLVGYLEKSIKKRHVSVQLAPVEKGTPQEQIERAQNYLDRYFGELKISIYWGTAVEFVSELKERWEKSKNG